MAFRYKIIRRKDEKLPPARRPQVARVGEEVLSGYIDGFPAARGEEFLVTELRKSRNVRNVSFRMAVGAPRNLPGWLELDVLVETFNGYRAFEVDDMSFVHRGGREEAESKVKDLRRLTGLQKMGYNVRVIEHIDDDKLQDRQLTRKTLEDLRI